MKISGSDIHLLAVFDSVVRNGGFSAAQAELGLSQPTISNHITALEERLAVKLCQRGRRGFQLTEKGRMVHEIGQQLMDALDSHSFRLAELKGNLVGRLKVAMVDCVASDASLKLPEAIHELAQDAPSVQLELAVERPQNILSGIAGGAFHLGIGSFDNRINGLEYEDLYKEPHALFCGMRHPLFARKASSIERDDVYRYPWVHRGYWSRQRQKSFQRVDADRIVHEIEAQLILILSGSYLGLLPEHCAAPFVTSERLRRLPVSDDDFDCVMQLVTKSGPKPKAIEFFCAALRRYYGQ